MGLLPLSVGPVLTSVVSLTGPIGQKVDRHGVGG